LANMAATANNNNVFVGEIPLSYRLTAERVAYDGQTEPVPEGLWAHVKLTIDWSNFTENSIDNITLKNGIASINPTWYSGADKTNAITLPNWRPNSASTTIHCWINVTSATHVLSVTVSDRYHTGVVITFTVPQQFRTMDFLAGGQGVAFGMPATQNGMFINMDLAIKEYSGNIKNIYDVFYPVGSYYETSDASFDPNTAWGGTWVKETVFGDGKLLFNNDSAGVSQTTITLSESITNFDFITVCYKDNDNKYYSVDISNPVNKIFGLKASWGNAANCLYYKTGSWKIGTTTLTKNWEYEYCITTTPTVTRTQKDVFAITQVIAYRTMYRWHRTA